MAKSEIELCFYARITKPAGLSSAADSEDHEQWEYVAVPREDGSKRGKMRVRKTTRTDGTKYEQTIKLPKQEAGMEGMEEYPVPITEEAFKAWKIAFGDTGNLKTRYVFISKNVKLTYGEREVELPEIRYEVDVLRRIDGKRSKWCKIDIEIDHLLDHLNDQHPDLTKFDLKIKLSSLPLGLENIIEATTTDEEERAAISNFWKAFSLKETS